MARRAIERIHTGQPTSDGAGVKLTRIIGTAGLRHLDPFLLLDEFRSEEASDYIKGFPPHPHRGFETVTYMLAGAMKHEDSVGNTGHLGPGSVQWMTAGRGIIHSEMPEQEEGRMQGFQLWVNLPAAHKMSAPRYQDIPAEQIPVLPVEGGGTIRLIAGSVGDRHGPVDAPHVHATYLDVELPEGVEHQHPLPEGHCGFLYVFEGQLRAGGRELDRGQLGQLSTRGTLHIRGGAGGGRAILVAGKPLEEPIVQHGPFVMNTTQQIHEAIRDYHAGRLGR